MLVTIFKNIKATSTPYIRSIDIIFERIKGGNSQKLIELIRNEPDKEKRNELKGKLPSICFSGQFKVRQASGIIKHSGLICLDFDGFNDDKELKEYREWLSKDEFTYSLFTSPSGNGLKVLVKIPDETENHKKYFDALKEYYSSPNFDVGTSDVSRVCYESFDPNIYVNYKSRLWDKKDDSQHLIYGDDKPILALKSENQIIQKLQVWFDKNYSMGEGERNNNLFKLASAHNDFGITKHESLSHCKQYESDDFTDREIEQIVNSAYKKIGGTKFFEDNKTKEYIKRKVTGGTPLKKIQKEFEGKYDADEIEEALEGIKENQTVNEFWTFDKKGKVQITHHKYKKYLEQNGFYKYYPDGSENFLFVKIEENIVDVTTTDKIKDFVLKDLYNRDSILPYEFMASATRYFKDDYLSFLDSANIDFKHDEENTCILYYQNCVVEVQELGIRQIDYLDLEYYVWRRHIINRDFVTCDSDNCDFHKFINLISGNDENRFISFISVIGYLLHSYKTSANNRAIILNDEVISENPNGGSGKGILCNALSKMKRVDILDGKIFDSNKSFAYQTVGADSQILVFDDVRKNFGFENLFSLITEGITIEKKNKDAIHIPVSKSPKIVITTNYTIGGVGGSHERRKFEIELSAHFGAHHTPFDEFNKMLFDDWDLKEWQKFDNFMIWCIQQYLDLGLVKYEHQNLKKRKYIKQTSFEFTEWVEDGNLPTNERLDKKLLFDNFIEEYPDFKKWLTRKKFAMWLDLRAEYDGYKIDKGSSNGFKWVEYVV